MVETQVIINYGLLTVIILGLGFTAADFDFENDQYYYCDERPELIYSCDGFTKYVSEFGKCINASTPSAPQINLGNKICKPGWQLIVNDTIVLNETIVYKEEPMINMNLLIEGEVVEYFVFIDDVSGLKTAKIGDKCLEYPEGNPIDVNKDAKKVKDQGGPCK